MDPEDPLLIGLLDPDPEIPNFGFESGAGLYFLSKILRYKKKFNILGFLGTGTGTDLLLI